MFLTEKSASILQDIPCIFGYRLVLSGMVGAHELEREFEKHLYNMIFSFRRL